METSLRPLRLPVRYASAFTLALALAAASLVSTAQTPSAKHSPALAEARPVSVGVSPDRLARIETMCQKAVADGDVPGVVAVVARHGKLVFHRAFGYADNAPSPAPQGWSSRNSSSSKNDVRSFRSS